MSVAIPVIVSVVVAFAAGWFANRLLFGTAGAEGSRLLRIQRNRYMKRLRAMHARFKQQKVQLAMDQTQIHELEDTLSEKDQQSAGLKTRLNVHHEALNKLKSALVKRERQIKKLMESRAGLMKDLEAATAKAAEAENELGLLRIERQELMARIDRLEDNCSDLRRQLDEQSHEFNMRAINDATDGLRAEMGAMREVLTERESSVKKLQTRLQDSEGRIRELEKKLGEWKHRVAPLTNHLRAQRELIKKINESARGGTTVATHPTADEAEAVMPATPSDDLKQVRGIGAAIERKLNEVDITRFEQLAELAGTDLAQVAQHLDTTIERVQREQWVEQARDLHEQKYPQSA